MESVIGWAIVIVIISYIVWAIFQLRTPKPRPKVYTELSSQEQVRHYKKKFGYVEQTNDDIDWELDWKLAKRPTIFDITKEENNMYTNQLKEKHQLLGGIVQGVLKHAEKREDIPGVDGEIINVKISKEDFGTLINKLEDATKEETPEDYFSSLVFVNGKWQKPK